jgi:hypothetical protein
MKNRWNRLLLIFIFSFNAIFSAQTFRGSIQGTVTDSQGAVVADADASSPARRPA